MPGRTFKESQQIRNWITAALADGAKSPSQVLEWIEQRKSDGIPSPSLPTISRVMQDLGYKPIDKRWVKGK